MIWWQQQIDELMRLYRSGVTSYQMASHFGVSRGAVCGRIHRERVKLGEITDAPRAPRKSTKQEKKMTLPDGAFVTFRPQVPTLVPDEGQLASIVDVTGCKWPVRDDAAFVGGVAFCNHGTDGKTYCPYHTQMSVASYSRKLIRATVKSALHVIKEKAA